MKNLKKLVIAGNIIFALWLLLNGIDEGFRATPMQLISYLALWALLGLNTYFLIRKK